MWRNPFRVCDALLSELRVAPSSQPFGLCCAIPWDLCAGHTNVLYSGMLPFPAEPAYDSAMTNILKLGLALLFCFAAIASGPAAESSFTIAVIPKGTTHEFWKSIN